MRLTKILLLPILVLSFIHDSAQAVDSPVFKQGDWVARASDCAACHTAPSGKPFAGGLKMSTPVGNIYSTNITPDAETGIGLYSYDDFSRALRQGIARDGHHLYPAMPYTSFSKMSDEDMRAVYGFFMQQVTPVRQANRKSDIPWPLSIRWPLALWDSLFHDGTPFRYNHHQSTEWNRGAYLVQGPGHCGTCHTPRGIGFQEKALDQRDPIYLTGGTLDNWHAPDLTGQSPAGLGSWTPDEIAEFLKTGRNVHSMAFGPMTEVIEKSTQYLSPQDLQAIAVYLNTLPLDPVTGSVPATTAKANVLTKNHGFSLRGEETYRDNCAACHRLDGEGYTRTFPPLAKNPVLLSEDPSSLINIVLNGGRTAVVPGAITGIVMPDFRERLDDEQVANVVTFIRNNWGNHARAVTPEEVKKVREESQVNLSPTPLMR